MLAPGSPFFSALLFFLVFSSFPLYYNSRERRRRRTEGKSKDARGVTRIDSYRKTRRMLSRRPFTLLSLSSLCLCVCGRVGWQCVVKEKAKSGIQYRNRGSLVTLLIPFISSPFSFVLTFQLTLPKKGKKDLDDE